MRYRQFGKLDWKASALGFGAMRLPTEGKGMAAPVNEPEAIKMIRYAIDYSKCMFCALCIDPCPTECIHMGDNHDLSGYDRASMIVEFTELAKQGLQTPLPIWMQKRELPPWAEQRKAEWLERARPMREEMLLAMTERKPAPKPTEKAVDKPVTEVVPDKTPPQPAVEKA